MKLTATEGCTCYSYQIDGVEVADLMDDESKDYNPALVKEAILKMLDLPEARGAYYDLFQDLITELGDEEFAFHCEQCGDSVYSYKLEL